jgi:hypothetical protein
MQEMHVKFGLKSSKEKTCASRSRWEVKVKCSLCLNEHHAMKT